jgi:hypothetical protein
MHPVRVWQAEGRSNVQPIGVQEYNTRGLGLVKPGGAIALVRSRLLQYNPNRFQKDSQIEPERPVFDVGDV